MFTLKNIVLCFYDDDDDDDLITITIAISCCSSRQTPATRWLKHPVPIFLIPERISLAVSQQCEGSRERD